MTRITFPDTNPAAPDTVMGRWLAEQARPEPVVREAEIVKLEDREKER